MTTIYIKQGGTRMAPAQDLFLDVDTGTFSLIHGNQTVNAAGGGGPVADATTSAPGIVEVDHAPSGAHPVALTTDGTSMPAGLLGTTGTKAAAGNDSRLAGYPDVTGDGQTPGGLNVAGDISAQQVTAAVSGGTKQGLIVQAADGSEGMSSAVTGTGHASAGVFQQYTTLDGNTNTSAMVISRGGSLAGFDYGNWGGVLWIEDLTPSASPVIQTSDHLGDPLFQVLKSGAVQTVAGLGSHGVPPQTAPRTLAQSAIDAITDANAQTAIQAIANALADIGALTLT